MQMVNYTNRASSSIIYLYGGCEETGGETSGPVLVIDTVEELSDIVEPKNLDIVFIRNGYGGGFDMAIYYGGEWNVKSTKGNKGDKGDGGEQGIRGPKGIGLDGIDGYNGADGLPPEHRWSGTKLQFKNPDGSWGTVVELKGNDGAPGTNGLNGAKGAKPNHEWNSTELRVEKPDGTWGPWVDLRGASGGIVSNDVMYITTDNTKTTLPIKPKTCYVMQGTQETVTMVKDVSVDSPNAPGREITIVCLQPTIPLRIVHHVGNDVPTLNHGFKLGGAQDLVLNYGDIAKFKFLPLLGMYYLISVNIGIGGGESNFIGDTPVILNPGESVGPWVNGDIIPTNGKTKQEAYELLVQRLLVPTFVAPTLNITFSGYSFSVLEVGTIFNYMMLANFDRGKILGKVVSGNWDFNELQAQRAGEATTYELDNTGAQIDNTLDITRTLVLGNNIFKAKVNHMEGEQPKDNAGNNYNAPLPSGSLTKEVTIVARRKQFYGATSFDIDTSAKARGLTNSNFETVNSFTINLNAVKYTIAIPLGKNLVSVITANNENITSNFVQTTLAVRDGGVGTNPYKIYTITTAVPLGLTANVILS